MAAPDPTTPALAPRVPAGSTTVPTAFERALDERSRTELREHLRAPNTRRAYESAWRHFEIYCRMLGRATLPADPTTVRLYISFCLDVRERPLTLASVGLHLAAIAFIHRMANLESPTASTEVQLAWEAARRAPGRRKDPKPKHALRGEHLRPLLHLMGNRIIDVRDKALLLIGFLGALRRSELCGMTVENTEAQAEGLRYRVHRFVARPSGEPWAEIGSKTNQFGNPEDVLLPRDPDEAIDPVTLYLQWLEAANIRSGFVWRALSNNRAGQPLSPASIRDIVRRRVLDGLLFRIADRKDSVLDALRDDRGRFVRSRFTDERMSALVKHFTFPPSYDPRSYGAHSLRSGFIVTARKQGKPDYAIRKMTRHKTETMIHRYSHSLEEWAENAARGLL